MESENSSCMADQGFQSILTLTGNRWTFSERQMRELCVNLLEPRTNGASTFHSSGAMTSCSMSLVRVRFAWRNGIHALDWRLGSQLPSTRCRCNVVTRCRAMLTNIVALETGHPREIQDVRFGFSPNRVTKSRAASLTVNDFSHSE